MLNRILAKLEDPQRPLLGPNYSALRFWGLLLPEKITKRIFYLFMHFLVTFFTATEYVDIWFVKDDINLLLNNIKITFLATVSVAKVITFLSRQKDWKAIIEYVNKADLAQRGSNNVRKNTIIWKYTKYCRKITYLYWSLMYTTVIIVMGQPMFKFFCSEEYRNNVQNGTETYVQVVSSWVPFDKNTVAGHIAASIFQSYAAIYGGGWITSFDTNAIVIMVFFKAELEMLRIDSSRLFGDNGDSLNEEDTVKILKDCHRRHVELLRYTQLFDSCLSPIMLLYMFVCSVMLCATAYQITVETNPMQQFLIAEYLIFGIAQLFMYCWHSNDVYFASKYLMLGPYESGWWLQNATKQNHIIILADQFNKNIVFTAGPFNDLSVSTFINILKAAYSYYTLLK
ncbi:odorant receptor 23a-like [Leptidea sinapis]|uniref:odorant receptor 23a-like n=1 Tax=Leptidea sinapis TaxID=189913 RepID=UPI0021221312|nr:odorant receptor 23a-like [Leptidea sinapis]